MTIQAEKKVPALRFPGFSGVWGEKRLGEISKINPRYNGLPDTFVYIDLESVEKGILKKEDVIQRENAPSRAQRVLQNNDILFQTVRPYQRNNFFFYKGEGYVASTGYAQIRTKQIPRYLYWFLHTEGFVRKVLVRCTGTSYPAINSNDLAKIAVSIPTLPEQKKIADFLTAIDTRIQQLTRKVDLLEQYKKGVLQKIFSQEIRFKDDQGRDFPAWEEKKLGKFLIKHDEKSTENNQYPVLTSSHKGMFFQKDYFAGQDVASKDNTGYNVVPRGYFTYRHMSDTTIFKFNINTIADRGIVSTLYPVFTTTKDIDDNFLKTILNEGEEFKRYSLIQKQGGSRTYMYFSKLEKLKLNLPTLPEQQKIANFLSAIDQKITHTKNQLDHVQRFKKGLLQQLFV